MWEAVLTIIIAIWILLTSITLWWSACSEKSWKRLAWSLTILLVPGLGAILWWLLGSESDFPLPNWKKILSQAKSSDSSEAS